MLDDPSNSPPTTNAPSVTFGDLGLRQELLSALSELGYEEPTPIQTASIPLLSEGRDLVGRAATGTGKTAAFALPMLDRFADRPPSDSPFGLVLVPTRELALQVSEALHRYGRGVGARVLPVFGGQPIGRQIHALARGVDIVIATPGRAVDHLTRGTLSLDAIDMVILDEADEMLDMGFAEDLERILDSISPTRQTVMFSATMPKRIAALARRHLHDPAEVSIDAARPTADRPARVAQVAYMVPRSHKAAALGRILDVQTPTAAIVFCRTRHEVDALTETLNGQGYRAEALHGGMNQESRDRVMNRIRAGTSELLVATDVAARGLDIDLLSHVVNYDVPSSPETYVHRIGRVGRAGREGTAITLAEPREQRLLSNIQRVTGTRIPVEPVPSVADLRSRQTEQSLERLRDALTDEERERFRPIVEQLAEEADLFDIALAALLLGSDEDRREEIEIPEITSRGDTHRRDRHPERDRSGRDHPERDHGERTGKSKGKTKAKGKGKKGDGVQKKEKHRSDRSGSGSTARLYFPIGRESRVGPGDLVGAITGETSLAGREIGSIEIRERFSLVEVPASAADEVIQAMRSTTIRGRRVVPRRDRWHDE